MQELKFVRLEDGALVVADDMGALSRVIVDDAMLSGIRQVGREGHHSKATPKEIQALIRSGKSAEDVAALTGAELADVERFETPVLAEREFILESALRVPAAGSPSDSDHHATSFGAAIQAHLDGLSAENVTWFAWRDEAEGWLISCTFSSHDVNHLAVWSFDHRKHVLTPTNGDAKTLSQPGSVGDRLIPKLRAVETHENSDRFDSGAFTAPLERDDSFSSAEVTLEAVEISSDVFEEPEAVLERKQSIEELVVSRDEEPVDFGQTADLLDALRRRRGERDSQPQPVLSVVDAESSVSMSTQRADEFASRSHDPQETQPLDPSGHSDSGKVGTRRGRQGMPSWDDILFGTRSDEDPA